MAKLLISAFPNEISDLVFLQFSFHDLINGFFVSHGWQDYIDGNDELSKRMFRLPKRLRSADTAACERFVDDLWAKTYPKVKDHEDAIWEHIESNPLYDDPDDPEDPEERDYHSGGHYRNYGQQYLHLGRLPIVPNHLEDDLRALWRTMFVSYPPVQRIE
jgi:hypothetical protein